MTLNIYLKELGVASEIILFLLVSLETTSVLCAQLLVFNLQQLRLLTKLLDVASLHVQVVLD